jgi:hypothetical protein
MLFSAMNQIFIRIELDFQIFINFQSLKLFEFIFQIRFF